MRDLDDLEFSLFDTETTGLDAARGDRIVEIAAIRVKGAEILGRFERLIDTGTPVSAAAYAVNHISAEMLAGAPAPGEVLPEFLSFVAGSCLCSYNMPFDLGFLENELRLSGLPSVETMAKVDILTVARKILPGLDRHALWFVARHLGVAEPQEHRAMADVMMMWEVFRRLKPLLRERDISTFDALTSFAGNVQIRNHQQVQERLAQIQRAIDMKTSFTMSYISVRDGKETAREVTPRELRRDRGQWYVIGFCSLKREERMFRVDNITGLTMNGEC